MSEMIYLVDLSMITCIVEKEHTEAVLQAATDVGARAAITHSVHGWGDRERFGALGVAVESERDVITFLVSSDLQDLVFETIYRASGLNAPGRGFMYITPVEKGAAYLSEQTRKQLGIGSE